MIEDSFNRNIELTIRNRWSMPALSDYGQHTMQYSDVAEGIAKLHVLFKECGIKEGDRIALCGRNMSAWAVTFLATLTYGAVAVPILHEFLPEQVTQIVNHSEARLLFVDDKVAGKLNADELKKVEGIALINDLSVVWARNQKFNEVLTNLNRYFGEAFPKSFGIDDVIYHKDKPEELALINYTSGTTSNSKGVMIPYRSLVNNARNAGDLLREHAVEGDNLLSLLPLAHTFGMSFEFIYEFMIGVHVHFLTRMPSPTILLKALAEIRPVALVCVPLIIEKVVRKAVMQKLKDPKVRLLLKTPFVGRKLKDRICKGIQEAFGGNLYEVVIGGAALNQEVENLLHDIGFNYTVGYGTTECGPLIACEDWQSFAQGSCGKCVKGMELRIDCRNPYEVPGEIMVKGENVMLGYYKNEEATAETLRDGWYHTGDLGIIDRYGNIFIKGRIKNLLLSGNGQNIYPEEIEDKLSNMPWVQECVVVQRDGKLVGLVYPTLDEIRKTGVTAKQLLVQMEENRKSLNTQLPAYEQVVSIELRKEEFEKTPKRSIKRYLYK